MEVRVDMGIRESETDDKINGGGGPRACVEVGEGGAGGEPLMEKGDSRWLPSLSEKQINPWTPPLDHLTNLGTNQKPPFPFLTPLKKMSGCAWNPLHPPDLAPTPQAHIER